MNRLSSQLIILLISISISCSIVYSGETTDRPVSPSHRSHRSSIDSLVRRLTSDSLLSPSSVGIEISVAATGSVLYSLNGKKAFQPASTAKILTTGTALTTLGPDYRFETPFTTNGAATAGVLHGDLIVRGSGDPLISSDDLDTAAAAIAASGIRSISGNLIGDISLFDSVNWGKGWMWDDEPNSDEAYITPLTVDKNSITVTVTPAGETGLPPQVSFLPQIPSVRLINEAVTSADAGIQPVTVLRPHDDNRFTVRGRIDQAEGSKEYAVSLVRPEAIFLENFRERLRSHGITVDGLNKFDSVTGKKTLCRISHRLDTVVSHINKWSYNLGAENLLRVLASERCRRPICCDSGLALISERLSRAGADTAAFTIADGSGVSRYSLISPDAMVKFLVAQRRAKRSFPQFLESLPVAGVNGTLAHRMKGTPAAGNVHAKTGTMTGISTLAGYVTTGDGTLLAFCIFVNNLPRSTAPARTLQDSILSHLAGIQLK